MLSAVSDSESSTIYKLESISCTLKTSTFHMSKMGLTSGVFISTGNCKGCNEITHVKCLVHILAHKCFINGIYFVTIATLLINGDNQKVK